MVLALVFGKSTGGTHSYMSTEIHKPGVFISLWDRCGGLRFCHAEIVPPMRKVNVRPGENDEECIFKHTCLALWKHDVNLLLRKFI